MDPWFSTTVTIICTGLASSGFWAWIIKRTEKKSASTRLLRGLARRQIISEGLSYINRGFVTKDEYEEYQHYTVEPYFELGGNGLAEKIFAEVQTLPIRYRAPTQQEIQESI